MSSSSGPDVITNGLVLSLDAFDKRSYSGSGSTWFDRSGNGNHGTLVNGVGYNSGNGGSLSFDGVNDYVTRTSSINTGQNFTVSVWVKKTKSGRNGLVANSYPYITNIGWYFFIGGFGLTNNLTLSIGKDQSFANTNPNSISDNQWYNFTAAVTNGGGSIQLYINGILQLNNPSYTSLTSVSIDYTTSKYEIGRLEIAPPDVLGGNISQVSIYNKALTATEILQNFNATRGRFRI